MTTPELPPVSEANLSTPPASMVSWGFWVWVGCTLVLILGVAVVGAAWAVRHTFISGKRLSIAQQDAVIAIATLPGTVRDVLQELMWQFSDDPMPLLMDRASTVKPYWVDHFPEPSDSGYLLFSGPEANTRQSIVELIRISDGKSMARWIPDWSYILSNTHIPKERFTGNIKTQLAYHPLLLPNGDIIFNTMYSLIRMNQCSSKPVWKLDNISHHSLEMDSEENIISTSKSTDEYPIPNMVGKQWENDTITVVTQEGKIISNDSIASILVKNNQSALIFGIGGTQIMNPDPIHVNQVTPALTGSKYWKKGDLLISSRHLSTIFLYRPATGKIIWHKTGPWLNQHSVDFVDEHRISVFNNNIIAREPLTFMNPDNQNTVLVYDFKTGEISEPFKKVLSEARPRSMTQGRARILPDESLFIEETNYGRMMRLTKDKLLWSYINKYKGETIGVLSWSRYLTQREVLGPLRAIESTTCANP